MFLFLIESQLLTAANSVIDSAAVAFLSPVLFNVLVIIGLIWLSLRILKKQQERIAELGWRENEKLKQAYFDLFGAQANRRQQSKKNLAFCLLVLS